MRIPRDIPHIDRSSKSTISRATYLLCLLRFAQSLNSFVGMRAEMHSSLLCLDRDVLFVNRHVQESFDCLPLCVLSRKK